MQTRTVNDIYDRYRQQKVNGLNSLTNHMEIGTFRDIHKEPELIILIRRNTGEEDVFLCPTLDEAGLWQGGRHAQLRALDSSHYFILYI